MNGKADPRISTVARLLSCYDARLVELEPNPGDVMTIDDVSARAERGARRLTEVGLGPSDPVARLDRKAGSDVDVETQRRALASRS